MSKKAKYFAQAEIMFIEQHLPISGIAERINVTEKTLRAWRDEGNWDKKKTQLLNSQKSTHAELYKLVEKMVGKMSDEIDEGKMPDASTCYFVKDMIDKLPKLKTYEEETKEAKEQKQITTADLVDKVNDILGA